MALSLGSKINLAILSAFVLIAVVFSLVFLPFQQRRSEESQENVALLLKTLVDRDRDSLAHELFDGRFRAAEIRLEEMLRVRKISSISLFDVANEKIITVGSAVGIDEESGFSLEKEDEPEITDIELRGNNYIRLVSGITLGDEVIGHIVIYYSLQDISQAQRRSLMIYGGLMATTFTFTLILLSFLTSRMIVRPLKSLRRIMQRIEDDGPGLQVEAKNGDEIGDLSAAFNRMSTALAHSYERIRVQQQELGKSETQYKTLFENAGDAILIHNLGGVILNVNQVALRRYGYGRDVLVGMNVGALSASGEDDGFDDRIRRLDSETQVVYETIQKSAGDGDIPSEVISVLCEYEGGPAV